MNEKRAFVLPGTVVVGFVITAVVAAMMLIPDKRVLALRLVQSAIPLGIVGILILKGFCINLPNQAKVLTFFGKYSGTVSANGFWWVNPFASKTGISLKVTNFLSQQLKVNDAHGNPIEIAAVIVWKVVDTAKASYEVESYHQFVPIQCETALRRLANHYPYEPHVTGEISLRSHPGEIAEKLREEVQERVALAGIEIIETQLSHLAYSPEIAQAMLRRQQAQAVIAARQMIVDGAIGMVEMALTRLERDNIVHLEPGAKATMVNNLMVTLVSEHHIQPVLSTAPMNG